MGGREAEVKAIEKKTDSLENFRMKLEDQQIILKEQWRDAISQYTEILNAIAPEDLQEVEKERRNIRYGGRKFTDKEDFQREKVYSGAASKRATVQRTDILTTTQERSGEVKL